MTAIASALKGVAPFLKWWGRELSGVAPARLQAALGPQRATLVVCWADERDGGDALLQRRDGETVRSLGRLQELDEQTRGALARDAERGALGVRLELPAATVATRMGRLPQAAEANLKQVLRFQIDRWTPFSADEIYFDAGVAGRDRAARTIDVNLAYAPRAPVDAALERLDGLGLSADQVSAAEAGAVDVDLLPASRRPKRPDERKTSLALVGLLVAFSALGLELSRAGAAARADALREELADLRVRALAAQDAAPADAGEAALRADAYSLKAGQLRSIEALAIATEVVGDDAWLRTFDLRSGELKITGAAADAASLIGAFERHERFGGATFDAPVTRDDDGHERFALSARFLPANSVLEPTPCSR